jgi:hypothetical protein
LTVDQVHDVERSVAEFPAATRVEIEERGAGYFEVTIYGKEASYSADTAFSRSRSSRTLRSTPLRERALWRVAGVA